MTLTSPFRRRRMQNGQEAKPPASTTPPRVGRGLPLLWSWAADANRPKLSGITLAHVLSGDTASPISFPEFETFLAFCDITLENLQFIVWYQDYRKRFDALSPEEKARAPSPCGSGNGRPTEREIQIYASSSTLDSSDTQPTTSSNSAQDSEQSRPDISAFHNRKTLPSLDGRSNTLAGRVLRCPTPDTQPPSDEIQNILATFFVPGSRKELSLSSEMRDAIIRNASHTTRPDVFSPVYEVIYETVECVSLPRFLENASTNINRPRQLFWYFSALPTFLLGIAIALLFILSPSEGFVVPSQSHRAWRLVSVPCFLLSSVMWYKGFRGFCPILFLRSSRQLRPWELERMADDKEAQAYCISLSNESARGAGKSHNLPPSPITPSSYMSDTARIAPFLYEMDLDASKESSRNETGMLTASASRSTENSLRERVHGRLNQQFRSRAGNGYPRPPTFGPGRVVEDKRIRAVHMHLWWSLVRFGLFWALVSAAVVLAVPSLH